MPLSDAQRAQACSSCAGDPDAAPGRYCAPGRCYCGHDACPAFVTYQPRRNPLANVRPLRRQPKTSAPNAWADREEPTWIDSM